MLVYTIFPGTKYDFVSIHYGINNGHSYWTWMWCNWFLHRSKYLNFIHLSGKFFMSYFSERRKFSLCWWCLSSFYMIFFFLIFQAPIQATKGYSYFLCRSYCKNFPACDWFSYSSANDQTCLLFTECPEKTNDITWVSSQQGCNDYQCYLHNVQCRVCLFIILCQTIL